VIEDEHVLRRLTIRLLQLEGFGTLEAHDGNNGVARATEDLPDLVICDIMMPGLDGFGVLQALRGNPRTAMIPFIFLTALVGKEDHRHGMEEGADDYITKPYTPAVLINSVRRRLEKRQRQLEESRQRSEEISLAVGALIPQEMLGPLETIETVTHLLALKYAAQDPQVAAMTKSVAQESARLRRLVRRLHLYAQLPELYTHRFDLAHTGPQTEVATVVDRVARAVCRLWQREPDLLISLEPAAVPIAEDYVVLLVEELIDNACKFSIPGTPIQVRCHGQREFWSCEVMNQGEGLSPAQIGQIGAFRQFLHGKKKSAGLGLGLALTQGITRLHGCEFTIKSDARTTTATVMVPLDAREITNL
jgi:DNA-binding response OmpR family regulator